MIILFLLILRKRGFYIRKKSKYNVEHMTEIKSLILDTNFIMGWFENAIKSYRRNPEEYESGKFDPTKKMEFLIEAKYEVFTTNVAKSEVFRRLFSELSVNKNLCTKVWTDFIGRFSIIELEINEVDFNDIADLCLVTQLGRGTIPNLVQLQFAKKNNRAFATGDKKIRDYFTHYHDKIYTYIELRQLYDAEKSGQSS